MVVYERILQIATHRRALRLLLTLQYSHVKAAPTCAPTHTPLARCPACCSKLRSLLGDSSSSSVSAYCVQHLQKPAVVLKKPPPTVVVVKPPEGHDWA